MKIDPVPFPACVGVRYIINWENCPFSLDLIHYGTNTIFAKYSTVAKNLETECTVSFNCSTVHTEQVLPIQSQT